jgi:hypothetical protein
VRIALAGGRTVTVRKTLTAAQLGALRRLRGTKLSITATVADEAHNSARQTRALSLKVPRS